MRANDCHRAEAEHWLSFEGRMTQFQLAAQAKRFGTVFNLHALNLSSCALTR
jgi:hypothetical protein